MKDAEFAALLEKLKKSVQERTRDKINEAMGYLAGYSDAIDDQLALRFQLLFGGI